MKVYLTPEEVERMAQAAICLRDGLLIRMLFWGSCRVSEALGIRVSNGVYFCHCCPLPV